MVVAGIVMAVVASLLFNTGIVLQALEARQESPKLGLRLALLLALLRRWRWLLGVALNVVGVVPQIIALQLAPFVVVQPALTVGLLLVLAVAVRTFGEHPGLREWLAVGAIIAGVALVAVGAPPHTENHRSGAVVTAVVVGLSACSLAPFLARKRLGGSGLVTMIASGVGFAGANIAIKLVSDDLGLAHYWSACAWAGVAVLDAVGATLTGMTAFQRVRATVVVPVTTALQSFLPIVLEPLVLREQWSQAAVAGIPLASGVFLAAAGTVVLARAPGVGDLVAAGSGPGLPEASRSER